MRRFRFNKFGLAENPVGRHVYLDYQGRRLLGEVRECYRRETPSAIMLKVNHFNGEPWPIEPTATVVQIIG